MSDDNVVPNPGQVAADAFYAPPEPEKPTPVDSDTPLTDPPVVTPEVDTPPAAPEVGIDTDAPPADADKPGDSEQTDPETEEVELSTFAELAEHLETEPEFLEGLTVSQKVNGEQIQVKVADALQTHRQVTSGDAYLSEAKTKAKAIVADVRQQKESLAETAVVAATILQELDSQLEGDIKSINWAQLRADDPAAAALKLRDVDARRAHIDGLRTKAQTTYRASLAKIKTDEENARVAGLPQQHEKLLEMVPEWSDEKKASAEQQEVIQYLQKSGFTEQQIEIANFNGPMLALAIKAKRYDSAKGKSEAIKKKVIKIPKVIKPGAKPEAPAKPKAGTEDRSDILYG